MTASTLLTILDAAVVWILFGTFVCWVFTRFVGPDPERDEREQA